MKRTKVRSQTGLLASMLLLVLLFVVGVVCVCALDVGHSAMVQTELQNAVDAGALAGARDYVEGRSGSAYNDALATTHLNSADGVNITSNTPGVSVKVDARQASSLFAGGICDVYATMNVNTILAKFMGRETPLTARATARGFGSVVEIPTSSLFPVAVSVDTITGHHKPLYACNPGDSVTFFINSRRHTNAAFTAFDKEAQSNLINSAIDERLSGAYEIKDTSCTKIGDRISLTTGTYDIRDLSRGSYNTTLLSKGAVILPLISGDGPYVQDRAVNGFVGVHINRITRDESGQVMISATIAKPAVKGKPGLIGTPTGIASVDEGIQRLSPGVVMLTPHSNSNEPMPATEVIAQNFLAAPNASGPASTEPGDPIQPTSSGNGSIASNFNSAPVDGTMWFNALGRITANPVRNRDTRIRFTNQRIRLTANGRTINIQLPDSNIILSTSATTTSTRFNRDTNEWTTILPASFGESFFLSGIPAQLNIPGNIGNVVWSGMFTTDNPGIMLSWQWGAAPFSSMNTTDFNALGVISAGQNAGVPINFQNFLRTNGGGTSAGGVNYTGSFSTASNEVPMVQSISPAQSGNSRPGSNYGQTSSGITQNQTTSGQSISSAQSGNSSPSSNYGQTSANQGQSSANSSQSSANQSQSSSNFGQAGSSSQFQPTSTTGGNSSTSSQSMNSDPSVSSNNTTFGPQNTSI